MNNGEDCPRCLGWTFDDSPCQSMLCQGIAEGRRVEREAIVAWLRRMLWRSSSDSAPVLAQASDTFDGINGFEDWVIHDVAIYLKQREGSDPSILMAERDRIEGEIIKAMGRKHASPGASVHINALSKSIGDEVAAALERGEHEKGEGK